MKIITQGFIGAAALILASAGNTLAIEGLKLSVQCSDVVLSWPSSDTNNQYFLVQYRPTLDPADQWQTLASWLPAAYGTNRTYFVHSNIVQGCVYSSMAMAPQGGGHGSPDGIGASANTNRFISATEIASRLFTIPAGQTNRHGYRFVFLFGCETASGTLPEAFGIIHRENVPGIDYVNAGVTPGAFAGWNHKQSAGILGTTLLDNANYLIHFQEQWAGGVGVREALRRAKENYSDVGFINFNKMKVFGNWELSYWAYNR